MILMEKQAIAKIAIKQQKEVEKMLEYELQRQNKERENAAKEQAEIERTKQREAAARLRELEALDKARKAEEKRREIAEREAFMVE